MIDERYLADARRCPSCTALLPEPRTSCAACGLHLSGPLAGKLWKVSVEVAGLLAERSRLVDSLRAQQAVGVSHAPAAHQGPDSGPVSADALPAYPRPASRPAPVYAQAQGPPVVRPEWTTHRVQNLLLTLGAGLLGVAAVIFLVVSWGVLGVGGRAAIMAGVTALAGLAAWGTWRRGLTATAEALSLLAVGLALLDCIGAWASDLGGLRDVDEFAVSAASTALVALAAGLFGTAVRTRSLRLSATVLGQLSAPLLLVAVVDQVDRATVLVAVVLGAQAVAVCVIGWVAGWLPRDARVTLLSGGALAAGSGALAALAAAYEDGSRLIGALLLVAFAAGTGLASEAIARSARPGTGSRTGVATMLRGVAASLVLMAVWAPLVDAVPSPWLAVALAGSVLALVVLAALLPADRRPAPVVVFLVGAFGTSLAAVEDVLFAIAGRTWWPADAWSGTWDVSARRVLLGPDAEGVYQGTVELSSSLVLLLVVAGTVVVAARVVPAWSLARAVAVPFAVGAGLFVAPALDTSYLVALAVDLVLAGLALTAGSMLARTGRTAGLVTGLTALASGTLVLAMAVAWSFVAAPVTLVVLPVAAALAMVVVLVARGVLRTPRLAASIVAGLLLVGEAGAVVRYAGGGWPAAWVVMLTLLAAASVTASLGVSRLAAAHDGAFWDVVRRGLMVAAVTAVLTDAGTVMGWLGEDDATIGLAIAVTAAVLLAVSTVRLPADLVTTTDILIVAALGAGAGLLVASTDAEQLWIALLAVGVGVAVMGLRLDRRWGWLAGVLLTGSTWVRLVLADVDAPEAYTVPPAVALLVVGWLRRRRDPSYLSWRAYAPGLALALVPSLVRAVTDAGELRPFLLGLAALAVLGVGVARRLQAPLVIGAGVLAVDAVVQLAPYLAAAYDAVPRWVVIGLVGLLLLGAGATFEQRMRDLKRVGRHVTSLG